MGSQELRWSAVKRLRPALAGLLVASLLFGAGPAVADPAAAEALFQEGVQLAARGELKQACEKLEASEALDVAVGTLLRLADCYERTGRLASAWSRFREAASLSQAQSMPERARIATIRADALEPRMARVTIHVPAEPPANFHVLLGETQVPRASWGSALPVDAGTLALEASAPGYVEYRRYLAIPSVDGARVDAAVPKLEPAPGAVAAASTLESRPPAPAELESRQAQVSSRVRAADRGYPARATGVTLAVVGGLGLATSGVLTIIAAKRNDASRGYCPEDPHWCTARGVQLRNEAGKLADAATVSAAIGGGLLATGIVVYWAAPKRSFERVSLDVHPDVVARGLTLQAKAAF